MNTERLEILKMLSEGKISPEEADMLSRALDEPSCPEEETDTEKGRRGERTGNFDRFTEAFSDLGREIENEVGKAMESVRWQDIGKMVNDAVDQAAETVAGTAARWERGAGERGAGDPQEWTFDTGSIATVRAETVNGSISVRAERLADAAKLLTTNGSIKMQVSESLGQLTAATNNGAVRMTLPADWSGRIDAKTSNGRVRSEFAVAAERKSRTRLKGDVGDGGDAVVKLRSTNGSIHLMK